MIFYSQIGTKIPNKSAVRVLKGHKDVEHLTEVTPSLANANANANRTSVDVTAAAL